MPDGNIIPEQAVFFIGNSADAARYLVFHCGQKRRVIIDNFRRASQSDNQRHVKKSVKSRHGRRLVCGRIQYFLPQHLCLKRTKQYLIQTVIIEFSFAGAFQKSEVLIKLTANIPGDLRCVLRMTNGRIENEQGHIEIQRLNFIPFKNCPADIIAAHQHVGFGQTLERTAINSRAGNIGAGIGA